MNAEQKKSVAVAALTGTKTVTQIAIENKSSRKFVRGQKVKATGAIDAGTITAIVSSAVKKAQQIHTTEDLSGIKVTANDELFHHNKPILSGIDTQSLYCYLLSYFSFVPWADGS